MRRRLGALARREFGVAEAAALLSAAFLGSALLGAVRQALLNARFGAGDEASAYYAAARLPETLFVLVSGGAISSALIPVLAATTRRDGAGAAWRLADLVLTALLATVALLVVVGQTLAPWFVERLLAPGFDAETTALTVRLTRILLVQPLILAVGSVGLALLNARRRFLLPALSVLCHNLAEIAGIGAAWLVPDLGVYGPTFGVLGGAALQVVFLLPALWSAEHRFRPRWAPRDPALRGVVALLIPNGLSLLVGYAGGIVDTAFATRAREEAALPALVNAWLLVGLPVRLIGYAAAQGAFPRLAAQAAAEAWRAMRRTLAGTTGVALALALPTAVGLLVLGRPTIRLLFEHGAFDAAAGSLTARLVTVYALGLPAYVATEVLTRGLIALRDTRTPLLTNALQLAGRAAIVAALIDAEGVVAVPIAFAATSALEAALLGGVLWWRVQGQVLRGR